MRARLVTTLAALALGAATVLVAPATAAGDAAQTPVARLHASAGAGGSAIGDVAQAHDGQVFGGWFGNWHAPALVSAQVASGAGVLTDVALFAWDFAGAGRPLCALTFHSGCVPAHRAQPWQSAQTARSLAALKGVRSWVSAIDLNSARAGQLSRVLRDPQRRDALTQKMTDWTVAIGVDGLDLDWENFAFNDSRNSWPRTRSALTATVRQLGARLHEQGKLLSVTVPAGNQPYLTDGSPNPGSGYTVYDWAGMAASIDRLNLMLYDYSWSSPGPIGPNEWARQVVRSAIQQVGVSNASKVIAGVPLYGKSWPVVRGQRQATRGRCPTRWRPDSMAPVTSVTVAQAWALADAHGVRPRFVPDAGEYTFRYSERRSGSFRAKAGKPRRDRSCRAVREVWFSDTRSVMGRARMAAEEGAGGVLMWNLASTEPRLFDAYRRNFDSLTSNVQPDRPVVSG